MTAHSGEVGVEKEASTHVRTTSHNKQRGPRRQRSNRLVLAGGHVAIDRSKLRTELRCEVQRRVVLTRHVHVGATRVVGFNHRNLPYSSSVSDCTGLGPGIRMTRTVSAR